MWHGLHNMMRRSQSHLYLDAGFDNMDEFWAITLTNINVSERHHPGLRADHHGRRLCDSHAFYNWAASAVQLMCQSARVYERHGECAGPVLTLSRFTTGTAGNRSLHKKYHRITGKLGTAARRGAEQRRFDVLLPTQVS
jgi:hypothetical protein